MTEAEMQTAVRTIRNGWTQRIPADAIERRVRQALPVINLDDLEAAFEGASNELVAEADELQQFFKARGD